MCNGWTNWETWKVSLEIFDGFEYEEETTADELQEITEEIVFQNITKGSFVEALIWDFLQRVNFDEIADHINSDICEDDD